MHYLRENTEAAGTERVTLLKHDKPMKHNCGMKDHTWWFFDKKLEDTNEKLSLIDCN